MEAVGQHQQQPQQHRHGHHHHHHPHHHHQQQQQQQQHSSSSSSSSSNSSTRASRPRGPTLRPSRPGARTPGARPPIMISPPTMKARRAISVLSECPLLHSKTVHPLKTTEFMRASTLPQLIANSSQLFTLPTVLPILPWSPSALKTRQLQNSMFDASRISLLLLWTY
jgi:hypothetical protein